MSNTGSLEAKKYCLQQTQNGKRLSSLPALSFVALGMIYCAAYAAPVKPRGQKIPAAQRLATAAALVSPDLTAPYALNWPIAGITRPKAPSARREHSWEDSITN
ncbi:MAG: hypothetical protein ACR650_15465 [Methylocystis sp.]